MSLIKCPNCEQEVSEQAKKCPNCGLRLLYGKRNKKNTVILCVVLVLSIFGVLVLRNNQLKNLKNKVEKYYSELNFEGVEELFLDRVCIQVAEELRKDWVKDVSLIGCNDVETHRCKYKEG